VASKRRRVKVVLDTNIVLASFSRNSPYRLVMDKFRSRDFTICITTEILLEYEEKLAEKFSPTAAEFFMEVLPDRSNIEWVNVYFKWNLIFPDFDDNKFVDCAIAARADYLVTNDKDYKPLKSIDFPKLQILTIEEFIQILESGDI
jgi:uncharacterized protein